jgi:transposase InsO family protein
VWTVDFKGWWYTRNREKVNPLTIRDEYSKFILAIDVVEKGDKATVKHVFQRVFKQYGIPRYIRSDNGPPFASALNFWGLSKLSVWWMTLGMKVPAEIYTKSEIKFPGEKVEHRYGRGYKVRIVNDRGFMN